MIRGKVVKIQRELFFVDTEKGVILCKAKGAFRKKNKQPFVGDLVEIRETEEDNRGLIEKILPRYSKLLRPPVVNVDLLLIVSSLKSPDFQPVLLDKYLLIAFKSGVEPILVLSKKDLVSKTEAEKVKKIYESASIPVYLSGRGDLPENLKTRMTGKTTAVAGPSGAGKSTLLNGLFGLELETGSVSEKTKRGKQTTRHIEMNRFAEDSYVMDTPGFSGLSLDFIDNAEEIKNYFPEFQEELCKFYNCNHLKEPGCGVKEAVEKGRIAPSRYRSYELFFNECKENRRM